MSIHCAIIFQAQDAPSEEQPIDTMAHTSDAVLPPRPKAIHPDCCEEWREGSLGLRKKSWQKP